MPDEKIDQKRPAHAENELKKMQQRLVDDTIDDSFPASDPPAWTTSGQKSVAATCEPDEAKAPSAQDAESGSPVRHVVEDTSQYAAQYAREAYGTAERYLAEGRHRFPLAERYYRQGRRAVLERAQESPLAALLIAGAVGYGLSLLIQGRTGSRSGQSEFPRYGRRPPLNEAQRHGMQGDPRVLAGTVQGSGKAPGTA